MINKPLAVLSLALCAGFGLTFSPLRAQSVQFNLETATLDDVQKAMAAGALTSVELTNIYLKRISAYSEDGYPFLNAFMLPNPAALEEAAAADQLRTAGTVVGPLHGVPFMLKGSFAVKGLAMTGGITLYQDQISPFDSFVAAKLKAAGGVFLGYANMDTWASSAGSTNSQVSGTTQNAYVPGYSASGSSGGPGVVAGANLAFFTFGGETGGSIRGPSDRAGVVGYKTSVGAVSVNGILPLVAVRDVVGPMTRYAIDNAIIMDIVTEYDPNDMWAPVFQIPGRARPSGFVNRIQATPNLIQKKFAVIPNWNGTAYPAPTPAGSTSNTTGLTTPSPEIVPIFAEARAALEAIGATIVESYLPPEADTTYTLRHPSVPPEIVTPPTRTLSVAPNSTNVTAYGYKTLFEALNFKPGDTVDQLAAKVIKRANTSSGNISDTSIAALYTFGADGTSVTGTSVIDFANPISQEYFQAQRYIITDLENWMDSLGVNAIIVPTSTSKTRTANGSPNGVRDIVNNMGLPMITVPMGVLPTGEPITLAFIGRYNADAEILAYAHAYEQATKKRIASPLAPALPEETFTYTVGATTAPTPAPGASAADVVPPVVAFGKVESTNNGLVINGSSADAGGIASISVTANGQKVGAKGTSPFKVTLKRSLLKRIVNGNRKVNLVVLARDASGNTTALSRKVNVPNSFL